MSDVRRVPFHPVPQHQPMVIRDAVTPPLGTLGYITASDERHALMRRRPLRTFDQPAPTLVKTGNSRMMAGWRVEPITLFEAARFGSFPDTFQWGAEAIAQIGNAVPPRFMAAIAAHLREHLFGGIMQPTVVSTFAGCGGSTLGYQLAGFRELLAVEWDDNAVATFRLNFPDVPVYHGDIAALSVEECLSLADLAPGDLDILDGSPPCQGFSTAGKRNLDDPRNQLFREYVRLLRGLRPKVFVMENVSGLVKGKMKLVFAEILRELKASGYVVSARLMNAMYFNVPQSRERLIFVGVREDLGIAPSYPVPTRRPITVREAIGHLEGCAPEEREGHRSHIYHQWQTGYNPRNGPAGLRVVRPSAYVGSFNSCRLEPDKPSATFVKSHNHWHYSEFRQLTAREAGCLASFPDTWAWRSDFTERIGNSVPPNFMRAIAAHIRDHILAPIGQGVAA